MAVYLIDKKASRLLATTGDDESEETILAWARKLNVSEPGRYEAAKTWPGEYVGQASDLYIETAIALAKNAMPQSSQSPSPSAPSPK